MLRARNLIVRTGHKMVLEDRVRLEIFPGGETGHFPEGAVEMGLVIEHVWVDVLDDAWAGGGKIAGLFQERMNVAHALQLLPA